MTEEHELLIIGSPRRETDAGRWDELRGPARTPVAQQ